MSDDEQEAMEAVARLVEDQQDAFFNRPEDDVETPDHAMLTKLVVLTEWRGSDGRKWMTMGTADANGDRLVTWEANGLLHEALYRWQT